MRFEDIQKVKALIDASTLLSTLEKAEWLQLLPNMNDKQVAELISILTPHQPNNEKPAQSVPPVQPISAPVPSPVNPEDLQKKVSGIAAQFSAPIEKHVAKEKTELNIPPETFQKTPQVDPAVMKGFKANQVPHQEPPKPKPQLGALKTAEDFAGVTPDMLHDRDPKFFFKQIYEALSSIRDRAKAYQMLEKFETSSLYQTYVEVGLKLLNDDSKDRNKAYETLLKYEQSQGKPYLTREEFEAMADFRTQLDKYFI